MCHPLFSKVVSLRPIPENAPIILLPTSLKSSMPQPLSNSWQTFFLGGAIVCLRRPISLEKRWLIVTTIKQEEELYLLKIVELK
jgi:hypothetical protein